MTEVTKLEVGLGLAVLGLCVFLYHQKLDAQDAVAEEKLKDTIARQQDKITASDQVVEQAQEQLKAKQMELENARRTTQTPSQVLKILPSYVPGLPSPIVANIPAPTASNPNPEPVSATIPAEDLKPLFDELSTGKEAQAKLAACEVTVTQDDIKIEAITKERDAYKNVKKPGFWRRLGGRIKTFGEDGGIVLLIVKLAGGI